MNEKCKCGYHPDINYDKFITTGSEFFMGELRVYDFVSVCKTCNEKFEAKKDEIKERWNEIGFKVREI